MKKRVRKITNFVAFNLLFFALYLNFIHKDKAQVTVNSTAPSNTAAFTGTIPVQNPEKYLNKENTVANQQATNEKSEQKNSTESKTSLN